LGSGVLSSGRVLGSRVVLGRRVVLRSGILLVLRLRSVQGGVITERVVGAGSRVHTGGVTVSLGKSHSYQSGERDLQKRILSENFKRKKVGCF